MATTQLFIYVTAVSVLCLMLCKKAAQQCASDYSATFGMMLQSHTYRTLKTSSVLECRQACNSDFRCHSFNYVFIEDLCELNNRTKEARPADFVPDVYRYYFRGKKELGKCKILTERKPSRKPKNT